MKSSFLSYDQNSEAGATRPIVPLTTGDSIMSHKLRVKVAFALWLVTAVVAESQAQSGRLREQTPQKPQGGKNQDDDALRLRVEEVLLPLSVRNNLGKLPADLR